jgi:hypothetical protein
VARDDADADAAEAAVRRLAMTVEAKGVQAKLWHRDLKAHDLGEAIQRGRTAEKVAARDLAAAPLGTDDEAAGTQITANDVAQALAHETRHPEEATGALARPDPAGGNRDMRLAASIVGVVTLLLVAAAAVALTFAG